MVVVEVGVKSFIYMFNGMEDISYWKLIVVVVVLDSEEMFVEIIVDGVYVDYLLVCVLVKLKGKDYLIVVIDFIWVKGC